MPDHFSPGALQKAVHDTLTAAEAAIPAGHMQAILLDATYTQADGARVRALYVRRVADQWTIAGEATYRKDDGPAAGVAVKWSGT